MDIREKLIESAARVFAETGYRGATTRRIAQEAGVNEITLFRHFGNKDALLSEAVAVHGAPEPTMFELPERPVDPHRELVQWCRAQHEFLFERRSLIRTCMGALDEHPAMGHPAKSHPQITASALADYFARVQRAGLAGREYDPAAPAWLLLATVFGDAMWRGILPEMYGETAEDAIDEYVCLTLRSIGVAPASAAAHPPSDTHEPKARTS